MRKLGGSEPQPHNFCEIFFIPLVILVNPRYNVGTTALGSFAVIGRYDVNTVDKKTMFRAQSFLLRRGSALGLGLGLAALSVPPAMCAGKKRGKTQKAPAAKRRSLVRGGGNSTNGDVTAAAAAVDEQQIAATVTAELRDVLMQEPTTTTTRGPSSSSGPPTATTGPTTTTTATTNVTLKQGLHVEAQQLGRGIIKQGPRANGNVLFEWERMERQGRNMVKVKLNRWLPPNQLTILEQPTVLDAIDDVAEASEDDDFDFSILPKKAAMHRDRKVQSNAESTVHKARLTCGAKLSKPVQHITASAMINLNFPNECFTEDATDKFSVFCRACKKSYPLIKSSLAAHCLSSKHKEGMQKLQQKKGDDGRLKSFLEDYFKQNPKEKCATVSSDVTLFRYRVVESLLGNGIPLYRLDGLH